MPDLSIVIPARNVRPALLHACLRSVAAQTVDAALELIVVDDGSIRACASAARALAERMNRRTHVSASCVRLPRHAGMAFARNVGVEHASAQYVLLLDADDALEVGGIAALLPALVSGSACLVFADHANVDGRNETIIAVRRKASYAEVLARWRGTQFDPFLHATFLLHPQVVRRDAFLSVGGLRTDVGYGDEIALHLRLSSSTELGKIVHVPRLVYRYRKNPESVVHHPALYYRLIRNIERILLEQMQALDPEVTQCRRDGRAVDTLAAHYAFYDCDGARLRVPWYDHLRGRLDHATFAGM